MIKVSVLIPVYNVEKYLKQCLDSVVNQTLKDIEIICVNDGSKDKSREIIEEYAQKDSRIVVIDKENSGYGDSMNRGIAAARGEYISIIESDDFADSDMLYDLYNLAKKYNSDVVKSDWYSYWTDTDLSIKRDVFSKLNGLYSGINNCPQCLLIQPSIWSAIYKKSFLEDNQIQFLTTPGAAYQDTSFNFKVLTLAQNIYFTKNSYIHYRQDNENSSINSKGKAEYIFYEFDEINKFLDNHPDLTPFVLLQKLISEYKGSKWTLERIAPELRQEFVMEFSKRFKDYSECGYLTVEFIKKIKENEIKCLINSPSLFLDKFEHSLNRRKWKNFRKNLISVRIRPNSISIKLFGKQIINMG